MSLRVTILATLILLSGCLNRVDIDDLSMRFVHPELYAGRDDFARENALTRMKRHGVLHRGMTPEAIRQLLGTPDSVTGTAWQYDLDASALAIEFDNAQHARRFTWSFDEGPHVGRPLIW